jgi:hypothetical protein
VSESKPAKAVSRFVLRAAQRVQHVRLSHFRVFFRPYGPERPQARLCQTRLGLIAVCGPTTMTSEAAIVRPLVSRQRPGCRSLVWGNWCSDPDNPVQCTL